MYPLKLICLFCLFFASFDVFAAGNDDWEKIPQIKTMRGMQLAWVAKNVRYNGLPMSIQTFRVNKSAEDVINKYEGWWKAKTGSHISRSKSRGYDVIGVERDRYFYSVQVREVGRKLSEGTLTVSVSPSEIKQKKNGNKTKFPLPGRMTLLNRIESNDNGVIAENILVQSPLSADYLLKWFDGRLSEQGWTVQKSYVNNEEGVEQLLLQKGGQHASIAVRKGSFGRKSKVSVVEINWVKGSAK